MMKIINVQHAHTSVKVVSIKLIIVYNVKLIEMKTPTASMIFFIIILVVNNDFTKIYKFVLNVIQNALNVKMQLIIVLNVLIFMRTSLIFVLAIMVISIMMFHVLNVIMLV